MYDVLWIDQEKREEHCSSRTCISDMVRIANAAKRRRQKKEFQSSFRLCGVRFSLFHSISLSVGCFSRSSQLVCGVAAAAVHRVFI